ncbi:hypothetical protein VPNG_01538 [Cytospora leucostoma]|uniref:Uncharacterized protein n=1 Tax=Cytospora leucostoma TaxID=1230097 RepID=A0A423XJY4_9PEZI|nr:hypothetical protein VPNG_01538 [Cytospora leucostoma]
MAYTLLLTIDGYCSILRLAIGIFKAYPDLVEVPISNNQQVLQDILRRHIGVDTAQLSQAPVLVAAAGPPEQGPTVRSLTIPVCNPRISGSVDHSASRSSSGPELRSPERQYYRPMTGVTPRALPPPGRRRYHTASLEPISASGAPVNLATDNNDSHENPMATNHSTYSSLREAYERVRLGFSPAYNGDPHLERNRSANVPNDLNCSLFLVNLPPDLTTTRLIAAVQAMGPTGRIYATHINAPEPERQHYGCAAKVIFFERQAAQAFFSLCEQYGFAVDGCAARVMWNRIKTAEQAHSRVTTRVLLIGGRRDFVNPETLTEYFRTKLQFQVDRIIPHTDGMDGENAVIEYRFGSFRCQAEAAKMALMREHQDVRCFFHPDPCDPSHPDWTEADLRRVRNGVGHLSTSLGAVPEDEEEQESGSLYQDYNSFGLR